MIRRLRYSLLPGRYAICRLAAGSDVPGWGLQAGDFYSISRTPDELSIVCEEAHVPSEVSASHGWVCLKLQGPFAFTETGILSSFLAPLAKNGVGIFSISTFDTDYVLIQEQFWAKASEALSASGHELAVSSR